jgi:hypothetical protein
LAIDKETPIRLTEISSTIDSRIDLQGAASPQELLEPLDDHLRQLAHC